MARHTLNMNGKRPKKKKARVSAKKKKMLKGSKESSKKGY